MTFTAHACDQLKRVLEVEGLDVGMVDRILDRAAGAHSAAVRLAVLGRMVGEFGSQGSNGDELWAVVRGGRVVTIMFRRSDQPRTPEAFRVARVIW